MFRTTGQKTLRPVQQLSRGLRRCHESKAPPQEVTKVGTRPNGEQFGGHPNSGGQGWGAPAPQGSWYKKWNHHYGHPRFVYPGFIKITAGVATGVIIGNAVSGGRKCKCNNDNRQQKCQKLENFDCEGEWDKLLAMANDFDEFRKKEGRKRYKKDKDNTASSEDVNSEDEWKDVK